MGKFTKRSVATVAAAVVVIGGAGAAYAAWNVNSTADVTVTAGQAAQVTVTASPVSGLVPGASAPVTVKISNTNQFNVEITDITGPVITVKDGGDCDSSESGIVVTQKLPKPIVLGKGMAEKTIPISDVVKMTNASANECQGKEFNLRFTLVGASTDKAPTPGLS
ncbi:hypothetical protein [Spirilliplanes yamanashiensis]|uniref:Uncharacterized protein n=1 Tax=Spirilliplanes yamanashiensis TaxID=42233 RepID=A0A8J4DH92_9ACTN|nr:hypothetical protein [Spirilliplanes yamanashiensis]MDP9814045.1 hypothetical protein [Spirilliplanes yamanashiensis]GIJ00975.1 hypothetical protein Sya03_03270 [Spirilliplanes yamanashiensis]